jgi:hypothetical protein
MKFAVRTIMVVAFLFVWFAPVKAAEVDFAFLETKWSTPTKDLKGFSKLGGSEKIAYYVNSQRKYTFFGNEVPNNVVFGFYNDKFFAVYVDIVGIDIFSQIKRYIQHKYGMPNKTSRETQNDLITYTWRLNQTQIKFKHYETSGKMKISFYYLPIAKSANAEIKKSLEAELPGPIFPLSPVSDYDGPIQMVEFMRF